MMKPGKYYIGDLCYVLSDRWDEFCKVTIDGHNVLDGEFNLADGTRFASYTTKYGDGVYEDTQNYEYPVDAGLIGCVLIEDLKDASEMQLNSGRIVEFNAPFTTRSEDGRIYFGNAIEIDTDPAIYGDEDEIY